MITALTLADKNGVDVKLKDQANGRDCYNLTGLVGIPAPRDQRRSRPQKRGSINTSMYTDGALMVADLEAWSTVGVTQAVATARDMVRPMRDTLAHGAAVLKWTEDVTGLQLQRLVKVASDVDPSIAGAASFFDFQAQFFSEDPRAYSQAQTTWTGIALSASGGGLTFPMTFPFTFTYSGGGTVTATNGGVDDTPPVFQIYGQATNPQIVNLETGKRIALVGNIAAGTYVEIDVAAGTVKLGGTTAQPSLIDSSNTTWFELPQGDTHLQLVAASFDSNALLKVLTRDAY